ncbi:PTS transporter subunit IIC [Clostridioides difficile]
MQKRFGIFGEPMMMGIILGIILGALAGYDVAGIFNVGMKKYYNLDLNLYL